jgi:hypothetical protein
MLPPQLHEVGVISLLKEYVFVVIAAIVDVIKSSVSDGWNVGGHGLILTPYFQT